MKLSALCLATFSMLMLATTLRAESIPVHPTDPSAVLIGTYRTEIVLQVQPNKQPSSVSNEEWVWMTDGVIEIQMNPNIQISGESGSGILNLFPTSVLYGMLSQAAVSKAVSLGFIQPNPAGVNVPVYRPNYVTHTGSGSNMQFSICGDGSWGVANYNVLFPVEGTVVVNLDDTEFATEFVNGTCESTFMEPIQNSISNNVSSLSNDSGSGAAVLAKSTKLDRVREKIRARRAAR